MRFVVGQVYEFQAMDDSKKPIERWSTNDGDAICVLE